MVLNAQTGARSTFDLFRVTQSGIQLRIYPELDANGQALPARTGRDIPDVGNWVNGNHYGIQYLGGGDPGKEKVTLLLTIEGDDKLADPSQRRGLRIWDQVRNTLYHRLNSGTAPSHWAPWAADQRDVVFGTTQKSKAKTFVFFRGMLTWYMTSSGPLRRVSHQNPKLNCIFFAPPAAQTALVELTMAELETAKNYNGDDWSQVFRYHGKLVHPQTGCLINFGRPGQSDPRAAQTAQAAGPVSFGGTAQGASDDRDKYRVEATLLEKHPCPVPDQYLKQYCMTPWDEILQIWKDEHDLVAALEVGFPDDLLIEAFRDETELLSPRLQNKLRKLTEAAVGSVPAPAAAAPASAVPPTPPDPATPTAATPPPPGAPAAAAPAASTAATLPWAQGAAPPLPGAPASAVPVSAAVPPSDPASSAEPAAPAGSQPVGTDTDNMQGMMDALDHARKEATPGEANSAPPTPGS
jgi:hypothetical protein